MYKVMEISPRNNAERIACGTNKNNIQANNIYQKNTKAKKKEDVMQISKK